MNPILVALDVPDGALAVDLATSLRPYVGGFKVGLELMMAEGPSVVSTIADLGAPVFADAKLHDIPNTVSAAARQIGLRGARWVTVHCTGGRAMIEAAVEGFSSGGGGGVLAVTVLTSLDRSDLADAGVDGDVMDHALVLAGLAAVAGAEGVVCSPLELGPMVEAEPDLLKVTPGIRTKDVSPGDQKRTSTPEDAMAAGADLIVLGRAITAAPDPIAAAAEIARSLGVLT